MDQKEIGAAIENVIRAGERLREMGKNNQQKAQDYAMEVTLSKTMALYQAGV